VTYDRWRFSPGTGVSSSTNKADCHDITEILLKVVLNTNIVLGGLIIILPFNKITFVFFHRKRKYGQQTR
jgi:hypothetical protein